MTPKEYQPIAKKKLKKIYPDNEVKVEWSSILGNKKVYSPRVDLAVGPFATERSYIDEYSSYLENSKKFIEFLIQKNNENLEYFDMKESKTDFDKLLYSEHKNSRCFLCIEIENKVSRKHLIGGLVNASALGRIGILIAWTPEKLKAFFKLKEYLKFLSNRGKNTFKTDNVLILDGEQFNECLDKAIEVIKK